MVIIFKNVNEEHRDIIEVFESHDDTYLDHKSLPLNNKSMCGYKIFVIKLHKMQIQFLH